MINETTNFNGNITVKDANGLDVVVAYISASLDGGNKNFNINMNVSNKVLITDTATNVAGETVKAQYTEFETAVKARAKELGYVIF